MISRRGARVTAGIAVLSLLASAWLLLFPGEGARARSTDADGYSRSAIGHLGLVALLRELGEPVVLATRQRPIDGVLVIAEPRFEGRLAGPPLATWLRGGGSALVVLPKRRAVVDVRREGWVSEAPPRDVREAQELLESLREWTGERSLLRVQRAGGWSGEFAWSPPVWSDSLQLLRPDLDEDEVVWAAEQGVFLARFGKLWVLTDPDLLANHGLLRGDNAASVVALLRHLRGDGPIVIDETMHGHDDAADFWRLAGQFPHVLIPAQLLLLFAFLGWLGRGRFGPVQPPPPAIAPGKAFLIDNIASLLRRGTPDALALRAWLRATVRRTAERLHAPPGMNDDRCREWLLARTAGNAREELAAALATSPDRRGRAAVELAQDIHRRLEELLHADRRDR
ncbi:MAG: hypothetical protein IPK26_21880 [Planctomycetes bacterium]|nr:hypothetical protein [Planctomycetota bacterium]